MEFDFTIGQLFNESCMKIMKEETIKGNTHVVIIFDCHRYNFSIEGIIDHNEGILSEYYRVKLHRG